MAADLDPALVARLTAAGVDLSHPLDPVDAWGRLFEKEGRRATLLDRYALEAVTMGLSAHELDHATRHRIAIQVIRASFPNFEMAPGSERASKELVEVVPYDLAWPSRFEEWRARLATAIGAAVVRIDHVGSTSVPGLCAKPVIDVQVSVRDMEDEASYVPAIEGTGVALRSRDAWHRYFRPREGARVVHVHVCSRGSNWERDHLLFRDYLRAHRETADAYGRLKEDLARRFRDDRMVYTESKSDFIVDAMERARRWAATTGWRLDA